MELSFQSDRIFRGTSGFEISLVNPFQLLYQEGLRRAEIAIDEQPGRRIRLMTRSLTHWTDRQRITLDEWVRIRHRVEKTLSLQGYLVELDDPVYATSAR